MGFWSRGEAAPRAVAHDSRFAYAWSMLLTLGCSLTDWIQAIGVLGGVLIAGFGLASWRAELRGRAQHEAVVGLLEAAIRMRDALQRARREVTWGGPGGGCSTEEAQAAVAGINKVVLERMAALEEAQARPEVLFGRAAITPLLDPIWQMVGSVRAAVENSLLARAKDAQRVRQSDEQHRLATWTSNDPGVDPGTGRLLASLSQLEDWARDRLA
jgi:hypothetical protein